MSIYTGVEKTPFLFLNMKPVELNFGFNTHIQCFEISWCPALSHTADDRRTTEHQQILKSYSSWKKKAVPQAGASALEALQPPARGQRGNERVCRVGGVFHDLGSPSLVCSGGQASLQPSLPFSAAGSLQQSS